MKKIHLQSRLIFSFLIFVLACQGPQQPAGEIQQPENNTEQPIDSVDKSSSKADTDYVLNNLFRYKSESELQEVFGSNAVRGIAYMPEGMGTYPVTVLYKGTADEVQVSWKDTTAFKTIVSVSHHGATSKWRTAQQVSLGTTLTQLEQLNGKPFTFYGFGWDYGGAVQWAGGKLDNTGLFVRLQLAASTPQHIQNALMGDKEIKSNDSLAAKAGIVVDLISLDK